MLSTIVGIYAAQPSSCTIPQTSTYLPPQIIFIGGGGGGGGLVNHAIPSLQISPV